MDKKIPSPKTWNFLEAPPGIGPGNKGFADLCLTAWLWRHIIKNGADDEARTRYLHLGKVALYQMSYIRIYFILIGADDEARTRYLHLGKVALYQMSYIRILQGGIASSLWCLRSESNQRHADFQSAALPTELPRHLHRKKWRPGTGSNRRPLA